MINGKGIPKSRNPVQKHPSVPAADDLGVWLKIPQRWIWWPIWKGDSHEDGQSMLAGSILNFLVSPLFHGLLWFYHICGTLLWHWILMLVLNFLVSSYLCKWIEVLRLIEWKYTHWSLHNLCRALSLSLWQSSTVCYYYFSVRDRQSE